MLRGEKNNTWCATHRDVIWAYNDISHLHLLQTRKLFIKKFFIVDSNMVRIYAYYCIA